MTSTTSDSGPIIDTNPVFDSAFVMTATKTMTIVTTKHDSDVAKEYPSDSYRVNFLMQLQAFTDLDNVTVPYDIVFELQDTTSTPIKYEDYTWVGACTNT